VIDLVIAGGEVIDGSGRPPRAADVAVRAGRIEHVGALPPDVEAPARIDAAGMLVMPGFIDAHVHLEGLLPREPMPPQLLAQGVTTVIVGQDGTSLAPGSQATVDHMARYFAAVNGAVPPAPRDRTTVADMLEDLDGAAVNVAYLIPNGNLRLEVVGLEDRPARPDELRAMQRLVAQGMDEGAVGLSTGLDYIPSRYAGTAEIGALCQAMGRQRGVYVSHMRGYGARAPEGVAEMYEIARGADVPVHISHYSGPAEIHLPLIERGLEDGVSVTFDTYPYSASATILSMLLLPGWVQEGPLEEVAARLADPQVRARLTDVWADGAAAPFERITLSAVAAPEHRWMEGMRITEAAARAGLAPGELVCDILADSRLAVGGVMARDTYKEPDIRALLRHPAHVAGSDGVYVGGHPHPRGFGTFARLLGVHTRELGDWDWSEAVEHLATRPARRFGLGGRGRLETGCAADIVVLDPLRVRDLATYDQPTRLAEGVEHVIVNGVPVLSGGNPTGARPGRALRPG
jgi:N-acyl-D-amino-acid deacylase